MKITSLQLNIIQSLIKYFFCFNAIKLGKNGSGASETKHWQDMISKPRQTVVQWHRLKPE